MGKKESGREKLILEATGRTALRQGDWVLIPPYEGPAVARNVQIELGNAPEYQLYNLKEDLGEQNNLAADHKERLEAMIKTYQSIHGELSD
jgi:arylsulfatase A-like enzyme